MLPVHHLFCDYVVKRFEAWSKPQANVQKTDAEIFAALAASREAIGLERLQPLIDPLVRVHDAKPFKSTW